MCTFPTPDWDYTKSLGVNAKYAWSAMYFNECMTGFEYQVASHMVYEDQPDLIQKGLAEALKSGAAVAEGRGGDQQIALVGGRHGH